MTRRLQISTGALAAMSGTLFFVGFLLLKTYFGYPDMIRAAPDVLLPKLHEQRHLVPYLYYVGVGIGGLCLFFFSLLARRLFAECGEDIWSYLASRCGMISGLLLYAGIIRYTFLFPYLAEQRAAGVYDPNTVDLVFQAANIYIGNSLAEHVEFTFTFFMLLFFNLANLKARLAQTWVSIVGFIAAAFIFYGNSEFLFALPGAFASNRIGSAALAVWLIAFGVSVVHRAMAPKIAS
jgi:hypothetical protein